ncbi:DNA-binding HxlR family transcriptional regulator [Rhizobium aquaticum]|uniref:DNA-binding HxlR family transcriptional regulator n=1 Tax=Rhizobium aquaticum TaxID=1549636 RepID=A0ABV2J613_9HYPH
MSATNTDVSSALEPCGAPDHEDCGLSLILNRLGEKWTVMTLSELTVRPLRYRELERALDGITQRMLTLTLRRLERDGFLSRHVEPTVPPAVTYSLTERGRSFAELIAPLVHWSRLNKNSIEASQAAFDRRPAAMPWY